MKQGKLLLMGTSGSMGVPVIGCECAICFSKNPRNKRSRSGALIQSEKSTILIDASADLREQALKYHLKELDALFITHAHQDHVGGLDDIRAFFHYREESLPLYVSSSTYSDLNSRFSYIFSPDKNSITLLPKFKVAELKEERGELLVGDQRVRYFSFWQGGMQVMGYRLGTLGYVSDIKQYPETIFEDLKGVDTLVLSALRFIPSMLHFTVDEAVDFAKKIGARKTYLTHIAHDLDYDKTNAYLPQGIELSYDGLELNYEY